MEITEERFSASPAIRLFLTVGLLGGFTTFSTYSYETLALMKEGMMGQAFLNAAGQVLRRTFCRIPWALSPGDLYERSIRGWSFASHFYRRGG